MRERTPFPRRLFEALPKLKLLITSGCATQPSTWRPRKSVASWCAERSGNRIPTAPLTMGLILELTRSIGRENARMHAGESWQKFCGIEIEGKTLGVVGLGKLGARSRGSARRSA